MGNQNQTDLSPRPPTTLDFYRSMFDGIDVFMSFWQPMLKGVGRMNLEVAQVSAQHGRSTLIWTSEMVRSRTPSDVLTANLKLYDALRTQQRDSIEKISAAMAKSVETPPGFEIPKLPQSPVRDVLVLPGDDKIPAGAATAATKPHGKVVRMRRKRSRPRATVGKKAKHAFNRELAQSLPRTI